MAEPHTSNTPRKEETTIFKENPKGRNKNKIEKTSPLLCSFKHHPHPPPPAPRKKKLKKKTETLVQTLEF